MIKLLEYLENKFNFLLKNKLTNQYMWWISWNIDTYPQTFCMGKAGLFCVEKNRYITLKAIVLNFALRLNTNYTISLQF